MTSKFSLYDFFAMIIPGGIIMAALWSYTDWEWPLSTEEFSCGCKVIVDNELPIWIWSLLTVVAYFIGLLNNLIADGLFRFFRNNKTMIDYELLKVVRLNGVIHLDKFGGNAYLHSKKSLPCMISSIIHSVGLIINGLVPYNYNHTNPIDYYRAYYALARHKLLGSVPIIEAQVALIRNSLLPLLLFVILHCCKEISCCIYLLFTILGLFIVMVQRQKKIYQMVWEAANYYEL